MAEPNQYRTEQSDDKHWWYTIKFNSRYPEGEIVGERFECKRRAMDQTNEYRKVTSSGQYNRISQKAER